MDCIYHSGTEAAAYCVSCGQPFCRQCLIETPDRQFWCRSCAVTGGSAAKRDPGPLAIASLAASVASIFFCPLISIAGMVMGFVELGKIRRGESPSEGRSLALAGTIVGSVVLGLTLLVILISILIFVISAAA